MPGNVVELFSTDYGKIGLRFAVTRCDGGLNADMPSRRQMAAKLSMTSGQASVVYWIARYLFYD